MQDVLPQPYERPAAELAVDRGPLVEPCSQVTRSRNALPMIPMRKNRKVRKTTDMTIYTLRNMVERCFNKLRKSRRLAPRYDKTADSFLGFIDVACIRISLRRLSTWPITQKHPAPMGLDKAWDKRSSVYGHHPAGSSRGFGPAKRGLPCSDISRWIASSFTSTRTTPPFVRRPNSNSSASGFFRCS